MSSNNSLFYKRAARILTVACGLLFSIFSLVYLFVLQKDVVGALHYSLSQGKTHYSPLAGAIIITVVLLIFRWGINGLMGLKGPVRALSYFPSCLLLGVLTDVDRTIFHGGSIEDKWLWLLPVLLLIYQLFLTSPLSLPSHSSPHPPLPHPSPTPMLYHPPSR